jgi:sugar (pentulose or hexulose) kinase
MNIIVIDCGASYIKGALVDYSTRQIKKKYYKPTSCDSDALKVSQTIDAIKEIIISMSHEGDKLHIAVANEMHGFIITDSEGEGYSDYISWQNDLSRSPQYSKDYSHNEYLQDFKKVLAEKDILTTGMPIRPGLPSVNLFYMMNKKPKNKFPQIYFYTLGDYIIRIISNRQPYIHPTNAAATGFYSILDNEWNRVIIHKLNLDTICFPEISRNNFIECDFEGRHLVIHPAIGDQQAALLGADLSNESDISFNMGTGAQVSVLCEQFELSSQYQMRPYFDGYFLKTIPHIPSGRALNVYYRFIKDIILFFNNNIDDELIWDFIISRANESRYESLKVDLSFFTNPITTRTMGAIEKIRENEFFIGNLFRSVFRQMSKNVYDVAARLADLNKIRRIIFSGGVIAKNKLLQEFILEYFSNIHEFHVETDETFKGLTNYVFCNIYNSERL